MPIERTNRADSMPALRGPLGFRATTGLLCAVMVAFLAGVYGAEAAAFPIQVERFRPADHLEGWDEALFAENAELYDFERFKKRTGEKLGAAELASIRADWNAERDRVKERAAELASDPTERALFEMKRSIARHPYLKNVEYDVVDKYRPFVFFVEQPRQRQDKYAGMIADRYSPWLNKLLEVFEQRYAEPLDLRRRADYPLFFIVVLSSAGAYHDFSTGEGLPPGHVTAVRAHYDPQARIAVTYEDSQPTARFNRMTDQRRAVLHEMTHALQHAYNTREDKVPDAVWYAEGLASHLESSRGNKEFGYELGVPEKHKIEATAERASKASYQGIYFFVTNQLIEPTGYAHHQELVAKRVAAAGKLPTGEVLDHALACLYAQSQVFVDFLHRSEDPEIRAAFGRFVRAVQLPAESGAVVAGKDNSFTTTAFERAFESVGMDALDIAFRAHLDRVAPQASVVADRRPTSEGAATSGDASAAAARTAPAARASLVDPAFDPGAVRIGGGDPALEPIAVFRAAAAGDLRGALAALDALDGASGGGEGEGEGSEDGARGRALDRKLLEGLVLARRAAAEHYRAKGRYLTAEHDGRKYQGRVLEVAEDSLVLERRRGEKTELPLASFPLAGIGKLIEKKDIDGTASVAAFANLLAGKPGMAARILKPARGSLEVELRDRIADYEARAATAAAWSALESIFVSGLPEDGSSGASVLARLETVVAQHGEHELVKAHREDLVRMAAHAVAAGFDAESITKALSVEPEDLGNGRVRLTYGFRGGAGLEDFVVSNDLARAGESVIGGLDQPAVDEDVTPR